MAAVGITQEDRDQEREDGCDADRDDEVGAVAQLAHERPVQKSAQLRPLIPPAHEDPFLVRRRGRKRGSGATPERDLFDVLDQAERFVLVAPELRRITPRRDQLPAIVLLVNNVAANVAQRRFQHVENKFRPRRSA